MAHEEQEGVGEKCHQPSGIGYWVPYASTAWKYTNASAVADQVADSDDRSAAGTHQGPLP